MRIIRPRVMPVLLLQDKGLVKTEKFKSPKYVGDPINAVKIFNEKEVDELVFLDIDASIKGNPINFTKIEEIASECFMPLCYGGGVKTLDDIKKIINLGVEKVAINTAAVENPDFITHASDHFGSSTIVISLDVKKNFFGKYVVRSKSGSDKADMNPVEFASFMQYKGAGEILINNIDKEGTQEGYDLELISQIASAVEIPVIACGGARSFDDLEAGINAGASAVAAGSMFVFSGPHRAVLISFPEVEELDRLVHSAIQK